MTLGACANAEQTKGHSSDHPVDEAFYSYEVRNLAHGFSSSHAGLEINLSRKASDGAIEYFDLVATIRFPDGQFKIAEIGSAPHYPVNQIWIGKINPDDSMASAVFSNETGGNSCCSVLLIATPVYGKVRILDIQTIFGSTLEDSFVDLNSDGAKEIITYPDNSFLADFSDDRLDQGIVPKVVSVYKGQFVDVSTDPTLKPYWEKVMADLWAACATPEGSENGAACGAYVAAAARIGDEEKALTAAQSKIRERTSPYRVCKYMVPSMSDCYEGGVEEFSDFRSAILLALRVNKYIDQ